MSNKFIVSTCDSTHTAWKEHWNNFPNDFDWLYHSENGVKDDKNLYYTEQEMCTAFGFEKEVSKKHYWNSQGNKNIIWFYAHFRMLYYYIKNYNYDWYWFFDDDVTCDNWEELIKGISQSDADFVASFVFQKANYKEHLPTIDKDTTSQHMWFERFPGDGDKLPSWINQYYGSFFPVVRFSNRALNILLQQFSWDYSGYSEGFVPTILNGYNHSLETIFQKDGTSKLYDINKVNLKHKHQNIRWDWSDYNISTFEVVERKHLPEVRYTSSNVSNVCNSPTPYVMIYHPNKTDICTTSLIYSNKSCTEFAVSGYYAQFDAKYRYWNGLSWSTECNDCLF